MKKRQRNQNSFNPIEQATILTCRVTQDQFYSKNKDQGPSISLLKKFTYVRVEKKLIKITSKKKKLIQSNNNNNPQPFDYAGYPVINDLRL